MTTTYRRVLVSLAAIGSTLVLGACASARHPATPAPRLREARPYTVRFDNDGLERVHVYLVDEGRQWLLGRVEPGATATLPIPEIALGTIPGFARLVAIRSDQVTYQVVRDRRARMTSPVPVSMLVSQRWWFSGGELMSSRR